MKNQIKKRIKLGAGIIMISVVANLLFGGKADPIVDIRALIKAGALLVDVRTAAEFSADHIEGAVNIPYDEIVGKIGALEADKARPILVYCLSGGRSEAAKKSLEQVGYLQVINGGGLSDMKKQLSP